MKIPLRYLLLDLIDTRGRRGRALTRLMVSVEVWVLFAHFTVGQPWWAGLTVACVATEGLRALQGEY